MVAHLAVEGFSIDLSCTADDDVLADIEVVVELLDLFGSDSVDVVLDSCRGLSEVVISEGSVVDRFCRDGVGIHR